MKRPLGKTEYKDYINKASEAPEASVNKWFDHSKKVKEEVFYMTRVATQNLPIVDVL